MLVNATIDKNGVLTVEYDDAGRDALLKAGVYGAINSAIDAEKIAKLELRVKQLQARTSKLRKKLRATNS